MQLTCYNHLKIVTSIMLYIAISYSGFQKILCSYNDVVTCNMVVTLSQISEYSCNVYICGNEFKTSQLRDTYSCIYICMQLLLLIDDSHCDILNTYTS